MAALSQGQTSFNMDNVCQGIKPNRIIISFVIAHSVAGDYALSPWNLEGFNLSDINVSVDGIPTHGNPIKVNFDKNTGIDCAEAFYWMVCSSA